MTRAVLTNGSLLLLWLAAFAPALAWWSYTLRIDPSRTSLVLAGLAAVLLARAAWRRRRAVATRLRADPAWRAAPLLLVAGGAAGFLAVERWLDVNILSASFFGVATYGLLGLYVAPQRWRRMAPIALLVVGLLPFGAQLDTYAGFLLRALSADAASGLLSSLGVPHVASETILVLENGVAHVDVACSGVRGLWTGSLFFLAATIATGHPIGARWFVVGVLHTVGLLVANVVRITLITLIAIAWEQPVVASVVHEPIGALGFLLVGAVSWWLLRRAPKKPAPPSFAPRPSQRAAALVAAVAVATIVVHRPRPPTLAAVSTTTLAPPAGLALRTVTLTAAESDLFRRFGAAGATKFAGPIHDRDAELLLVDSHSWRAHHPPELCLAASGHDITRIDDVEIDEDHAFRVARMANDRTAIFWFQSRTRTTGHALERILRGIVDRGERWVLVSVLVDGAVDERDLYRTFSSDITSQLERNLR